MAEPVNFTGKYKHERSENFDEFLRAKGAGFMARKMAQSVGPTMEIEHKDDKLSLKVHIPVKTFVDINCTLGEEFETTRMDGQKVKAKYVIVDGVLVSTMTDDKGVSEVAKRAFDGPDVIILSLSHGDVQAKRYFKRVV